MGLSFPGLLYGLRPSIMLAISVGICNGHTIDICRWHGDNSIIPRIGQLYPSLGGLQLMKPALQVDLAQGSNNKQHDFVAVGRLF